jgi:hypothetical protein
MIVWSGLLHSRGQFFGQPGLVGIRQKRKKSDGIFRRAFADHIYLLVQSGLFVRERVFYIG